MIVDLHSVDAFPTSIRLADRTEHLLDPTRERASCPPILFLWTITRITWTISGVRAAVRTLTTCFQETSP